MVKAITPRRLFYGLVAFAFVVANPLHLPFSLPWLVRRWEGTVFGAFLDRYEGTILVISTAYFMMAMTSFYIWLWTKRTRRRQAATPSLVASVDGQQPAQPAPYRGPGGGKRPPRARRRRARR